MPLGVLGSPTTLPTFPPLALRCQTHFGVPAQAQPTTYHCPTPHVLHHGLRRTTFPHAADAILVPLLTPVLPSVDLPPRYAVLGVHYTRLPRRTHR